MTKLKAQLSCHVSPCVHWAMKIAQTAGLRTNFSHGTSPTPLRGSPWKYWFCLLGGFSRSRGMHSTHQSRPSAPYTTNRPCQAHRAMMVVAVAYDRIVPHVAPAQHKTLLTAVWTAGKWMDSCQGAVVPQSKHTELLVSDDTSFCWICCTC